MISFGTLVQFSLGPKFYPGQIIEITNLGSVAHIYCLAPNSKYQGKEYIRYIDDIQEIQTSKEFLLLGLDIYTKFPYANDVSNRQRRELEKVSSMARTTTYWILTEQSLEAKAEERRKERKERQMIIKRSEVPVSLRGKQGGLSVSVRENGQIGFSTEAAKALTGYIHCAIDWDEKDRVMTFEGIDLKKVPKGTKAEDLFEVATSKASQRYINATGVFRQLKYDYKASGTHSFEATVDGKKISFTLPEKMTPKEKTPRKPKSEKTAGAPATTNADTSAAGPELVAA